MLRVAKYWVVSFIEWLGFVHRHRWSLQGPDERLHVLDQNIDRKFRLGYAGCLFNTMSGNIYVGKNVMFGHDVRILTGRHNDNYSDPLQKKETLAEGYDIFIGNGVWLTTGVIVTGGVRIGTNSTILPGSVVSGDIPPAVVAGGIPCRVISKKKNS